MTLQEGEKYLSIQIMGKNGIQTAAFKNKKKNNPNQPDFIGNGISIWVKEKKADTVCEEAIETDIFD